MSQKNQANRLTLQHKKSQGCVGIFGQEARSHDAEVVALAQETMKRLQNEYPRLSFHHRKEISKKEINLALQKIDKGLGQTLFVPESKIKPDGGLIEVKDDNGVWRIILVSEAKHQEWMSETSRKGSWLAKTMINILWSQEMR